MITIICWVIRYSPSSGFFYGQEPPINFRFFSNAPDPLLDDDMFSIRWKGYLQPYSSGVYHFAAYVDDGVYFSVDGEVILDHWLPGSNHVRGSKYLDAGRIYPVELRMFEDAWA